MDSSCQYNMVMDNMERIIICSHCETRFSYSGNIITRKYCSIRCRDNASNMRYYKKEKGKLKEVKYRIEVEKRLNKLTIREIRGDMRKLRAALLFFSPKRYDSLSIIRGSANYQIMSDYMSKRINQ